MVHHHSIRFKMDNKKNIVNLEYFREMLHICPRFPAIINKCLSGKSLGYDSLRLSQAQFLWGFYHKRDVDFAYLLWEDLVYQVKHKDTKKSNMMYYPRNSEAYKEYYAVATGATPPKTKASIRKKKSSFDSTVTLPPTAAAGTRLFTYAKGKQPAKASKAKSLTALSEVAITKAEQLKLDTKRSMQQTHISQASGSGVDEGTGTIPGVLDVPTEEISVHDEEETRDEESFDPIPKTPKNMDDEGNDEENLGLNIGREEGQKEEDDEDELYRDVNINLEGRVVQMADVHTTQEFKDSHVTLASVNPDGIKSIFETTSQMDVQPPTTVAPLPLSTPILTLSTIATITIVQQAPTPPTSALSTLLQNLPNFGSLFGFDHRLKTLEDNFSEFVQINQLARAVSSILGIVQRYMDQQMNEAVKVAIQIQSDRLRNEAQVDNEEFLKNLNENIQKIIKEQVKEQVKFYGFAVNRESARDVYSKRRIIAVTKLKMVKCDGMLTDVHTALDDRLKGIRMKYLP
nr:hypothetical protein [Tanacetum cinerariifolium]